MKHKTIRERILDTLLSLDFSTWKYSGAGIRIQYRNDEALHGIEREKRFEYLKSAIYSNSGDFSLTLWLPVFKQSFLTLNELSVQDLPVSGSDSFREMVVYLGGIGKKIVLVYQNDSCEMHLFDEDNSGLITMRNDESFGAFPSMLIDLVANMNRESD